MAFCPICKGNHDVGTRCYDHTGQILWDIGIAKKQASPQKLKQLTKEANRVALLIGIIAIIIIAAIIGMVFLRER